MTLTAGDLTARVDRKTWRITFEAGGRVLTTSGWRGMAYMQTADRGNHLVEQLSLGVGENVYGLGERFTAFVKNGQAVETTRMAAPRASRPTRMFPFYLTNRGYGVLVNETGPVSFEVASERVARVQFSLAGRVARILRHLRAHPEGHPAQATPRLTGRPALPPAVVVRAVALDLVHDQLRRGDGHQLHRRHEAARPAAARLSLRLLLDARVRLVRISSGIRASSPTRRHAPAPARDAA